MLYDAGFWTSEGAVAAESAEIVIPWVFERYPFRTCIDIGCGTGEWAGEARDVSGGAATGVDLGVPRGMIAVNIEYIDADLVNGYPCSGYDLAICLEVGEHLPRSTAPLLVEGLAQAPTVLFSAATPHQPGVGHVNCQEHVYWHELFARHGMFGTHIGPLFQEPVADFYRRNMFIYARPA
jgi:hypothetical protein